MSRLTFISGERASWFSGVNPYISEMVSRRRISIETFLCIIVKPIIIVKCIVMIFEPFNIFLAELMGTFTLYL